MAALVEEGVGVSVSVNVNVRNLKVTRHDSKSNLILINLQDISYPVTCGSGLNEFNARLHGFYTLAAVI